MQNFPNNDREHLRLLSLFHYIMGGLTAAFSLFSLLHISMGIWFISSGDSLSVEQGSPPPSELGWVFVSVGGIILLIGLTTAIFLILSGRFLARRTHYTFSFVVACLSCLSVPIGTVLGVFTIIVLSRHSVKQLYEH